MASPLKGVASGPRDPDIDGAAGAWAQIQKQHAVAAKSTVTLLQMLNPVAGKGANRPKAASTAAARQLDGFWLIELLKLVRYFRLAVPLTIQGTKDRKTYVLCPRRVRYLTVPLAAVARRALTMANAC